MAVRWLIGHLVKANAVSDQLHKIVPLKFKLHSFEMRTFSRPCALFPLFALDLASTRSECSMPIPLCNVFTQNEIKLEAMSAMRDDDCGPLLRQSLRGSGLGHPGADRLIEGGTALAAFPSIFFCFHALL